MWTCQPRNMRTSTFLLNCIVFCVLALSSEPAAADPVADIVNKISADSIWNFNSQPDFLYTQPGDSRRHNAPYGYTGWDFYLAQNNIRDTFISYFGTANVTVDTAGDWNNVWAIKPGTVNPDKIYLVGSHYDSFSWNATDPAPGGNDNASGVSAVLEMARVFKDYQFANTIVFCAFDGEESGLNGSYQWTQAHSTANIAGMIEMDCIGFNPNDEHHNKAIIYTGHAQSQDWANGLASAMSAWTGGNISATAAAQPYDCSDYARFEDHGWPGLILAEDGVWEDYNTVMHTVNDNVLNGHIDPVFEGQMVQGVAGFLATQLQPVPEPSTIILLLAGVVGIVPFAARRWRMT
jgi:hypothetical protein